MKDPVPYNEYYVHKSKHVTRSAKVRTPQQFTMNVPGRKTNVYSQNEMYGSQYMGEQYSRTYLPYLRQNAKNKEMDQQRKEKKTESNAYGGFYDPQKEYTGRVKYSIKQEYVSPHSPRYERNYQVHTNSAPGHPLSVHQNQPLPPISPQSKSTSYPNRVPRQPPRSPSYSETVYLPFLNEINLKVTFHDNSTMDITKTPYGYQHHSSAGNDVLALSDVREMSVYLKGSDNSVARFETIPKIPKYSRYE